MTTWKEDFPATSKGARAARIFVSDIVATLGGTTDEAALVVSELAANAVLHAATPFTVMVVWDGTDVTIEVADGNPAVPQVKDHGQAAPTGRGLRIVDQLTDEWGVNATEGGKVVWVKMQPVEHSMA